MVDSQLERGPHDRCPFRRPFDQGFDACPSFQGALFTAFDTHDQKLGTWYTCRHLASGQRAQHRGHFYARCSLGTAEDRLRWVAQVTSARLEVVRVLQEEFDQVTGPHWKGLLEAKRSLLANPTSSETRDQLNRLLAALQESVRILLKQRQHQFESVGLQAEALSSLLEGASRAWAASTQVAFTDPDPAALRSFEPEFQAFLAEPELAPWRWPDDGSTTLYEDATLRICQAGPQRLRFSGTIDAANCDAVAGTLQAVAASPEYHFDLGGLVFCDVAGLRLIVNAAQRLCEGGKLYLDNIPPHLDRIAGYAGWTGRPGLVLVRAEAVSA